jgi:hypothetical protein
MKSSVFWDRMPCGALKVNRHFRGRCHLSLLAGCFMLFPCMAYSSTLEMEATWSFEMVVDFQLTAWHYVLRDTTLSSLSCLFPYLAAQVL